MKDGMRDSGSVIEMKTKQFKIKEKGGAEGRRGLNDCNTITVVKRLMKSMSTHSRPIRVISPQPKAMIKMIKMLTFPLLLLITLTVFVPNSVLAANIVGTPGNDNLVGTPNADTIDGRGGNDQIQGLAGDDRVIQNNQCTNGLKGAGGNDFISGGDGSDCIMGGGGTDRLAGDKGNDLIAGGNGADKISGGPGVDGIIAFGGNDNITVGDFGPLKIADNALDGVSCGTGQDTVYIAPNENDVVDNDCEIVIIRP